MISEGEIGSSQQESSDRTQKEKYCDTAVQKRKIQHKTLKENKIMQDANYIYHCHRGRVCSLSVVCLCLFVSRIAKENYHNLVGSQAAGHKTSQFFYCRSGQNIATVSQLKHLNTAPDYRVVSNHVPSFINICYHSFLPFALKLALFAHLHVRSPVLFRW